MTPQNILVTGSSGFIGLPVARALAELGHRVIGLDPALPGHEIPGVTWVRGKLGDVRHMSEMLCSKEIDTVIHAGGISGPMLAPDDPYLICEANVIGSINLIEAVRLVAIRRLVYCSSAAVFGNTPPAPVPDDAPLRPTNLYGASKGAVDLILQAYRHQYGLNCVSLRLSNVYGPGRKTDCAIRMMLSNALAGRPTRFDWGIGHYRPYLFVDDAVRAILCAIAAPPAAQFEYNIAGPDYVEMPRIGEIVRGLVPGSAIAFGSGADPLGYERKELDISAAKRDLEFAPKVGMEQGIAAYLTWFRSSGILAPAQTPQ
jgi:nucleoside-diphosphate-sugar epimerase